MANDTTNTIVFFASLDEISRGLLELITSFEPSTINSIPFEGSWTAAQLAEHVTRSNRAIAQALEIKGRNTKRDPAERVPELKQMFLDFTVKFNSPEFISPKEGNYERDRSVAELKKSIDHLKDLRAKTNLRQMISLPAFGEITKLEVLYFVLYHTMRHVHQLKNILKAIEVQRTYEYGRY